jgi:hypothetical protein
MVNTRAIVPETVFRAGVTKAAAIVIMHMPWPMRLTVSNCLQMHGKVKSPSTINVG